MLRAAHVLVLALCGQLAACSTAPARVPTLHPRLLPPEGMVLDRVVELADRTRACLLVRCLDGPGGPWTGGALRASAPDAQGRQWVEVPFLDPRSGGAALVMVEVAATDLVAVDRPPSAPVPRAPIVREADPDCVLPVGHPLTDETGRRLLGKVTSPWPLHRHQRGAQEDLHGVTPWGEGLVAFSSCEGLPEADDPVGRELVARLDARGGVGEVASDGTCTPLVWERLGPWSGWLGPVGTSRMVHDPTVERPCGSCGNVRQGSAGCGGGGVEMCRGAMVTSPDAGRWRRMVWSLEPGLHRADGEGTLVLQPFTEGPSDWRPVRLEAGLVRLGDLTWRTSAPACETGPDLPPVDAPTSEEVLGAWVRDRVRAQVVGLEVCDTRAVVSFTLGLRQAGASAGETALPEGWTLRARDAGVTAGHRGKPFGGRLALELTPVEEARIAPPSVPSGPVQQVVWTDVASPGRVAWHTAALTPGGEPLEVATERPLDAPLDLVDDLAVRLTAYLELVTDPGLPPGHHHVGVTVRGLLARGADRTDHRGTSCRTWTVTP
ncbi:MAG: hypothetical protein H6732_05885 [Alphaproteobacteria bacterium]|nr:hypothetical protein [Alphaproteobacteria bacterium]